MATGLAPGSVARPFPAQNDAEKIRVLAVTPQGLGLFVTRQISSLIHVGIDVCTFSLVSRTSPLVIVKEYIRLRSQIRRFRPHLIHAHYGTVTSLLCAVSSRVPLVITFRGSDLNGDPDVNLLRSRVAQLFSHISSLRGHAIICMSRRLRDRLWWRRGRVRIIPDGVNPDVFRPEPKDQARALLGWEPNAPIVVFNGAHRPRTKGLEFVQAAVRVAERTVGLIQLIAFDGKTSFELMPWCLNAADCLALASVNEGSPNVVKEALACNLPVVATDVGDVAERLEQVHPSRVVPRDVVEFGKALAEILTEKRRSNGREWIAPYHEARVAESVRSVYEAVVRSSIPAQSWRPWRSTI